MIGVAELFCYAALSLGMPNADFACDHMETVIKASEKYDIRPELLIAMIRVESRWSPRAVSKAGACGLTQVLPKYTKRPKLSCEQLKNPTTSIMTGAKKLNFWIHKYGKGNERVGLCGYLAGFRCKGKNKNKKGYNRYAPKVLKYASLVLNSFKEELKEQVEAEIPYLIEGHSYYECDVPEEWYPIED
jgi:soluble lytic murein transglycosylase-like protein